MCTQLRTLRTGSYAPDFVITELICKFKILICLSIVCTVMCIDYVYFTPINTTMFMWIWYMFTKKEIKKTQNTM